MEWDWQEGKSGIYEGHFMDPAWTDWRLWLLNWIYRLVRLSGF